MPVETRSPARAVVGVGITFASNGVIFAALLPWYPQIAARLGLNAAEFGFVVSAFAVGALVSSALPAPLVARFGPVPVAVVGTSLTAIAIMSAPWAGTGWVFALCLFFAGLFDAIVDVAQNVAGIRVQDAVGRSILSSMHALWSLGGVVSGFLATVASAAGVDIRLYLAIVPLLCVALVGTGGALVGGAASRPTPSPTHAASGSRGRMWWVALVACLPLAVIAICGTMVEDFANNWAAMSAVQIGGLEPEVAGIAFTIVIGAQCIGRFSGDLLIQRFGRPEVARFGGLSIALGGLLIVTTQDWTGQLFIGLALAGFGSATLVPSALTAAAKLPGVSESAGVTVVSWLMRIGFLVTSPLIGLVAFAAGLRVGLSVLLVVGAVAMLFAGALRERSSSA